MRPDQREALRRLRSTTVELELAEGRRDRMVELCAELGIPARRIGEAARLHHTTIVRRSSRSTANQEGSS